LAARASARWAGPYAPDEVGARLAGLEVVALPSLWEENAPLVADEARAAGRAILASEIGGLPERLSPVDGARLLPPGDLDAWTSALADPGSLRRLARSAQASTPPATTAREATTRLVARLARR